ncbi:iron chelate uptake ABC transporter family permease subunit [Streptococcus loxodontisalivarius]|uniref:Iron complex transport system permease protein n=1 Tax=Streptococcus loxodontisalivarius TaxID=1349415 RepID=A0ABS2PS08_9STRE|nr:iron chelate uptake ABC transporter family permease subunit [Streptococcus loxodontisalivarius]MBM7642490.1 iron complex transport system permease protein [Streptococcus loxodontisalivarius]
MVKSSAKQVRWLLIVLGILALLAAIFYLVPFGSKAVPYLIKLRSKKLLTYALVAILSGFSTISFQTVTANRFLTPSVLGLESFYVLIQSAYLFFYWHFSSDQSPNALWEFILVLGMELLLFLLLFPAIAKLLKKGFGTILLICMALGTLFRSLSTFMQVLMDPNEYDKLQSKLFASLQSVNSEILGLVAILTIISVVILYRKSAKLNVFYLGKETATLLGINVVKEQKEVLWLVVLMTAASTAMVGPMAFFGFMLANLTYQLLASYDHRASFILSSLLGFLILVIGQSLLERVFNYNLTISMLVELFGGAFFFYLLYKERVKQ